jgi:hypothetical protein
MELQDGKFQHTEANTQLLGNNLHDLIGLVLDQQNTRRGIIIEKKL